MYLSWSVSTFCRMGNCSRRIVVREARNAVNVTNTPGIRGTSGPDCTNIDISRLRGNIFVTLAVPRSGWAQICFLQRFWRPSSTWTQNLLAPSRLCESRPTAPVGDDSRTRQKVPKNATWPGRAGGLKSCTNMCRRRCHTRNYPKMLQHMGSNMCRWAIEMAVSECKH